MELVGCVPNELFVRLVVGVALRLASRRRGLLGLGTTTTAASTTEQRRGRRRKHGATERTKTTWTPPEQNDTDSDTPPQPNLVGWLLSVAVELVSWSFRGLRLRETPRVCLGARGRACVGWTYRWCRHDDFVAALIEATKSRKTDRTSDD